MLGESVCFFSVRIISLVVQLDATQLKSFCAKVHYFSNLINFGFYQFNAPHSIARNNIKYIYF